MSAQRTGPPAPSAWVNPVRAGFEALLAQGPVMLAVSSAFDGVAPDAQRVAGPHVCLRFGRGLSPAIPDMAWDDVQLVGTLAFGGAPFTCRIPWAAVVAIKLDGAAAPTSPARPKLGLVPRTP